MNRFFFFCQCVAVLTFYKIDFASSVINLQWAVEAAQEAIEWLGRQIERERLGNIYTHVNVGKLVSLETPTGTYSDIYVHYLRIEDINNPDFYEFTPSSGRFDLIDGRRWPIDEMTCSNPGPRETTVKIHSIHDINQSNRLVWTLTFQRAAEAKSFATSIRTSRSRVDLPPLGFYLA